MVTIQYLSDLHLENTTHGKQMKLFKELRPAPDKVDVLALLGDIGNPFFSNYKQLMDLASQSFPVTLVLSGNHEYYSEKTIAEVDEQIRRVLDPYENVFFLQRQTYTHLPSQTLFLGATLWSHIPEEKEATVVRGMNDYYSIHPFFKDQLLTPSTMNRLHTTDRTWFEETMQKEASPRTVLLSHYGPSFDLVPDQYRASPNNCCYYSDLNHWFEKEQIKGALYGHSHGSNVSAIHGVPCANNCYGYYDENIPRFSFLKTLTV